MTRSHWVAISWRRSTGAGLVNVGLAKRSTWRRRRSGARSSGRGRCCRRGLRDVEQPDPQAGDRRPAGRGAGARRRCARRSGSSTDPGHAWIVARAIASRRDSGDGRAAHCAVGPPADHGREQPGPATGVTSRMPPGRNFGSVASRSDSGMPSAMPPAPCTSSLPGELQVGVHLVERPARGPSRPRRRPGRARGRARARRRTRAPAWGGARSAGTAANDADEALGVARPSGRRRSAGPRRGTPSARRRPAGTPRLLGQRRRTATSPRARGKQNEILPGLPCAARSTPPGTPPPTLRTTSCTARPIVRLARLPWPSTLPAPFIPIALVPGPLQMITGPTGIVVASTPWMLNSSLQIASTIGDHPRQVLGLAPGHHRVDRDLLDGDLDEVRRHDGDDVARARASCPRASAARAPAVGGTTGRPSVQPRSNSSLHLVVELGELDAPGLEHVAGEAGAQRVDEVGVDAHATRTRGASPAGRRRGRRCR